MSRRRVAADLGVGLLTLGKWVSQYRPTDLVSAPQADLARENERLRLENPILKGEMLKKLASSSRASASEVRIRAQLAACLARGDALPCDAGIDAWLPVLARTVYKPTVTR